LENALIAELISGIAQQLGITSTDKLSYDVLVCPPSPYLGAASIALESTPFALGAQNVSPHQSGAYTGEVSLPMLAEHRCQYVLLGHSERRELFAETDTQVAEKFAACVQSDLAITPVLCIGETLADRQAGNTQTVVAQQLDAVLDVVGIVGFTDAVVAYEPVWAIGTGETATPEQAQEVHAFIRHKLAYLDADIANKIQILYGGSVKPGNAEELFAAPDIDGGLIGGASLNAESFAGICRAAQKLMN